MVSLFDCDENNELLCDKYTYCSSIEVSESESLPSLICLSCVDRLMFAYQFKQQCISSNETLKECLLEFKNVAATLPEKVPIKAETEVITIKQENGVYLQYELPVEEEIEAQWPTKKPEIPQKRGRGRPRKYPNELGEIALSPYNRKKDSKMDSVSQHEQIAVLMSGNIQLKAEPDEDTVDEVDEQVDSPLDDGQVADFTADPDYVPEAEKPSDDEVEPTANDNTLMSIGEDGSLVQVKSLAPPKKGRGRPKKHFVIQQKDDTDEPDEDVLLKETILANSEPIPEHILNPQPKEKKKYPKKKYYYEKTHTCEVCGASFRSNASLQAHIRRHLGIKPFVCNVCGYSCVLNMELRRHMMRHTGVKPYKCRICERRFGDFGSRQKHERLHYGERPYHCSLCGKSFTYSYVLANHMLTHTGEKKYSCEPCNKKFTKAHHLKYHNKVHHKEIYVQQQLEQEAKKQNMNMRQHINITELSGMGVELLGVSADGGTQSIRLVAAGDHHQLMGQDGHTMIDEDGNEIDPSTYTMHQASLDDEDDGENPDDAKNQDQQGQVILPSDIRIQQYTSEAGETTIVCELPGRVKDEGSGEDGGGDEEMGGEEEE